MDKFSSIIYYIIFCGDCFSITFDSLQVEDLELSPVLCADDYPVVVHGTNKRSWELIKNEV